VTGRAVPVALTDRRAAGDRRSADEKEPRTRLVRGSFRRLRIGCTAGVATAVRRASRHPSAPCPGGMTRW
jgi:hypothetical protein